MDLCVLEWNVCRVCLLEVEGVTKFVSVYTKLSSDEDQLTIAERIMTCSKIIVSTSVSKHNKKYLQIIKQISLHSHINSLTKASICRIKFVNHV